MKRLSILAASLALVASAQAATVTSQFGLPLVEATTEINPTGLLNRFDSALGTVTNISLEIFGSATTFITLTSNAATNVSGRAQGTVDLEWSSGVAALDALLTDDMNFVLPTGGNLTYTPGQSRNFGPIADNESFTYDLTAIAAALSGAGTFPVSCLSTSGVAILGGGGNLASDQDTTAACGARVTYTFTPNAPVPVPEPTSLALVGLALAAAGVTAARRKA